MSDHILAELAHVHRKLDFALLAIHQLLTRHPDMSNRDDLLAALAKNDAALTANDDGILSAGRNVDALIAAHGDSDAGYADVLAKVEAQSTHIAGQGQAIAALGAKVTAALPVEAPVVEDAPVVAAPVEVPVAPVAPADAVGVTIPADLAGTAA